MGTKRENTLVVDFSVLPKRPDVSTAQKFICAELALNLTDATYIQFHNVENRVYIAMVDASTAARYHKTHHLRHTMKCDDKEYKIPVYVDDDAVNVRVHDLPPSTLNTEILKSLEQYGTVLSISREKWKHYFPGVYNGVRVPKTCRFCTKKIHPRKKCAEVNIEPSEPVPSTSTPAAKFAETDFPSLTGKGDGKVLELAVNEAVNKDGDLLDKHLTQEQHGDDAHNSDNDSTDTEADEGPALANKRKLSTEDETTNDAKRISSKTGCQNDSFSVVEKEKNLTRSRSSKKDKDKNSNKNK